MIAKKARWLLVLAPAIAAGGIVLAGCGSTEGAVGGGRLDASTGEGGPGTGLEGGEDGGGGGQSEDATTGVVIIGADAAPEKGCSGYPGQNPASLPGSGCCTSGPSHCVPSTALPASLASAFATCTTPSGSLCVPDPIIEAGSEYVPASCTTTLLTTTLEGVCLSKCITLVSGNADESLLKQETCAVGELCVPCINPLTNGPTGACNIDGVICGDGGSLSAGAGDGGGGPACPYTGPPLIDPTTFPACSPACSGAHCVPSSLVPAADQSELASCTSTGGAAGFCAPDTFIESAGEGVPPMCVSIAGAEGRCLSTCLPEIASEGVVLPQSTCAAGTKCAPCYDPVATDASAPTGACSLACDKPADPPTIINCPYTGAPIIDPSVFPACSPACSGAHCVPASLVPVSEQSELATCPGGFCAPDTITENGGEGVPPTCVSIAGAEGRCLSTCLPEIAGEAALLPQSSCAAGTVCAPCYNPTASDPRTATGACGLACDKPADPPTILTCPWTGPAVLDPATLPACDSGGCSGAHCLPAAEVPTSVQSQLASCQGGTGFCTPDVIISTGDNFIPTTCDPFPGSGAPGRCLSDCLPSVQSQVASGTLVQSTCVAGEDCVPCNNPFTGASTGACTLGCDTPPAAFTFPQCCNDGSGSLTGTCVPTAQVPSSEQSELSQSGNGNSSPCPSNGADYLCVPDEYLPAPYNTIALQGCPATFLNLCGVCVSECIVDTALDILGSSDCAANHKCVPCDIASSTPGCSSFCN